MKYTEEEMRIIHLWRSEANPLVSICCTAYNHESYIEDTLKGFLMQKTTFPFEILLHDDASSDKTQDIIRKYEEKYPNIIKPIYQTENQYSKGKRVNFTYNYSRAKGKYIALCEGDDYWTEEHKLQKQVEIMEGDNEIKLCVHATGVFNISEGEIETNKIRLNMGDKVVNTSEVILGGGEYGHTSSFIFRREITKKPPHWFIDYPSGDTPLRLLAAYNGKIYYLDKEMSVYRRGVKGSWTNRMRNDEKFISHWGKSILIFDEYNKYTNYKYSNIIRKRNSKIAYKILDRVDYSQNNKNVIEEYYPLLSRNDKVKYLLKTKLPLLFKILKTIRGQA